MKNCYVLPVCFAAAAHGALLFGFTKQPRRPVPPQLAIADVIFHSRPPEPPPEEEEIVSVEPARREAIDAPAPIRSPEPAIEITTAVTMPLPPLQPEGLGDLRVIPLTLPVGPGTEDTRAWQNVIPRDALDNPPRTRFQAAPLYPFEAKRTGMTGEVQVEFVVDEQGRVTQPRVIHATHAVFEEPTLRAVARWQFEPGRKNGRVVRFRMSVPIHFTLNEGP